MSRRARRALEPMNLALMMVEGRTEALYLSHLKERNSNLEIIVCESENKNPSKMVANCISKMREKDIDPACGDKAFCVFDVDMNEQGDLLKAMKLAKEREIALIISNPRFEIWLLMHFRDNFDSSIGMDEIENILENYLGREYSKTEDVWDKTGPLTEKATTVSRAISSNGNLVTPIDYFSFRYSTGMHMLIDEVNKLKKDNAKKLENEKKWKTSR